MNGENPLRLQKYLAEAGVASRRKCEELIKEGRVKVNGLTAVLGSSVEEGDEVLLDGRPVRAEPQKVVYAFNKPKNVICTGAESEDRVKVVDYFSDVPLRLYTVGRLDYDSEGLIFVTNDGEFADKLTHPRYMKLKTYRVTVEGELTRREEKLLQKGVELDDGPTAPAIVRVTKRGEERSELLISIIEGRNRQVRRMMQAVGHATVKLTRVAIGDVKLGSLKPGQRRLLTDEERASFFREG